MLIRRDLTVGLPKLPRLFLLSQKNPPLLKKGNFAPRIATDTTPSTLRSPPLLQKGNSDRDLLVDTTPSFFCQGKKNPPILKKGNSDRELLTNSFRERNVKENFG